MPRFSTGELSDATLNSVARYILYTRHPDDRGGWGIGHIGPIPEGMVAWLLRARVAADLRPRDRGAHRE